MKLLRLFVVVFVFTATVLFAQDAATQFTKDLRSFLAARAANDPMNKTFPDSNTKEEAVFAYRNETMALFKKDFLVRCAVAARQLKSTDLEKSCNVARHPKHLESLADAFDKTR